MIETLSIEDRYRELLARQESYGWEADAMIYAQNAELWRSRSEDCSEQLAEALWATEKLKESLNRIISYIGDCEIQREIPSAFDCFEAEDSIRRANYIIGEIERFIERNSTWIKNPPLS